MEEKTTFVSYDGEADKAPACIPSTHSMAPVWWGLAIGAVLAGVFLVVMISTGGFSFAWLVAAIFLFAFGASLPLEESAAREVMLWMASKSISFPGLIWELSFDGFLWLIGMKILFWILGVVFGIIVAILGFVLGVLVAPFTYPFNLISYIKDGD